MSATRWVRSSVKSLHTASHSTNSHQVTAKWLQRILEDHSEPPRLYAWTLANLPDGTGRSHVGKPPKVPEVRGMLSEDQERRRIYILGVGNIGRLYAVCLARSPDRPPITLVVHRKELLAHWRSHPGIELVRDGKSERNADFDVEWWTDVRPADGPAREPGVVRHLVVATKAADAMAQVDHVRRYLRDESCVAFTQNGMCRLWPPLGEAYARHRWPATGTGPAWLACVTTHGVTALGPFRSVHASPADVALGAVRTGAGTAGGDGYLADRIVAAPGLKARWLGSGDLWVAQLEKLVVNSVINPLTAVLGCRNREVFEDRGDGVRDVVDALLGEAGRTLRALVGDGSTEGVLMSREGEGEGGKGEGIIGGSEEERLEKVREQLVERFSFERLRTMLYEVAEKVAANTSSMLQDVRAGKKTEIEDFNGWLVEMARYLGDEGGLPAHEKLIALVVGGKTLTRCELVRHFLER
ncbi:6-phosphogluconate dehydrogenase C-terminal domain-like protein [Annulohypoxylon bovei var. microspora]|nr:6-phosphogluconate dehydrogenase C-terminal domain-like protein [Annulohypoxylon bovei var. microspora]